MYLVSIASVCTLLMSSLEIIEATQSAWQTCSSWESHDAELGIHEGDLLKVGKGAPFFSHSDILCGTRVVEKFLTRDVLREVAAESRGVCNIASNQWRSADKVAEPEEN